MTARITNLSSSEAAWVLKLVERLYQTHVPSNQIGPHAFDVTPGQMLKEGVDILHIAWTRSWNMDEGVRIVRGMPQQIDIQPFGAGMTIKVEIEERGVQIYDRKSYDSAQMGARAMGYSGNSVTFECADGKQVTGFVPTGDSSHDEITTRDAFMRARGPWFPTWYRDLQPAIAKVPRGTGLAAVRALLHDKELRAAALTVRTLSHDAEGVAGLLGQYVQQHCV